ncbi:3'-5' exoribonuclease [Pontibacillus halophilus JSM 076056 = DSM 19796]|uniref:3'-5' exoribonuclease n=1 Tax=Pontibacillus halophilus JSM 076056 = DSM 19796 TaxID=1385510 RepID=A0A0A5I9U2_9BACI|nr:3'-5' exoribonuclease YhaM [Pontibacillus halophilus]KGX92597.1 3'-5' exoribonuclease [Pontibacillus halophilus JSM 076056 = DSM 19796]
MNPGISQYAVGDSFDGFLLIKSATKGTASNGKPFLTLIVKDQSGEIEAKLWDATKEDEATYLPDQIVKFHGEITQFRNKPQLKIFNARLAQPTDGVKLDDFLEKAPVSREDLMESITERIFEMSNPNLQRITRHFVSNYQEGLLTYPAAVKNHHEYVSGLAHHVVSMLNLAKSLVDLYPDLNKDLLYAGVILHDLGKLRELSGPATPSYTLEGQLLGHIPMMMDEIGAVAKELGIEGEEVTMLQHMILSHHGKGEWGSPKPPLIREAEILHQIDNIDAKMNMLNRALEKVQPGEFTDRMFAMDNRRFYKPLFTEPS